ncbi:virion structural protein [Escherichia phage vB_EcoM_VR25]|uniref:Uncharacterized protein n=1 Tax=Escherichia phage vB_EcoM_VR25 TaxID=1567028 RepID=A0A0A7HCI9_9CAUD|nr:virion structural protein [Escherichia phage vB_EcoM_VR25]AIZ02373.1 hypothetical protein VR25_029 [Escherichia phage vB_EcoM_VR25]
MSRLNKRQLKKARKKRAEWLIKNADHELVEELLANQLRHITQLITVKSDHMHMFDWVNEETLKLIAEHSK